MSFAPLRPSLNNAILSFPQNVPNANIDLAPPHSLLVYVGNSFSPKILKKGYFICMHHFFFFIFLFLVRASGSPYTLAALTAGWQKKMGEETNQFLLPLHLPSHLEY